MTLIKRHTILFLKDKTSVFFSLLSVFIIIVLYLLFLSENIAANLPKFQGRAQFVFLWMFAGIVAVTTATATLGALGKYMEDKVSKKSEDFLITKITPRTLAYSYMMYTFIIGLVFSVILLLVGFIYMFIKYDTILTISLELVVIVLLSTLMHMMIFYLITSSFKTLSAFSGFSSIVGTLIGFLAGIYIPIGVLPVFLQKIITIFPTTQSAVLLKNVFMSDILSSMSKFMPKEVYQETLVMLGIQLQWNDEILSSAFSYVYLTGFTFLLLVFVIVKNKKT